MEEMTIPSNVPLHAEMVSSCVLYLTKLHSIVKEERETNYDL